MKRNDLGQTPTFGLEQLEPRQLLSTYYALPFAEVNPQNHDGSSEHPFAVEDFWYINNGSGPVGDDTLVLLNNNQDGSVEVYDNVLDMIKPERVNQQYLCGYESGGVRHPITIRTQSYVESNGLEPDMEGKVLIDGGEEYAPVLLNHNDYFDIIGINATLTPDVNPTEETFHNRDCISVESCIGVDLHRVCAWNSDTESYSAWEQVEVQPDVWEYQWVTKLQNNMVWSIGSSSDLLLEDVAGWGEGRKIFQFFDSYDITVRRAWGRWEYSGCSGPQETFSVAYYTHDILFENCVGTWDATGAPNSDACAIFMGDGNHVEQAESNIQMYGCIAYVTGDESYNAHQGFNIVGFNHVQIEDCISYMETASVQRSVNLGFFPYPTNFLYGDDPLGGAIVPSGDSGHPLNGHAYMVVSTVQPTGFAPHTTGEPDWPTDGGTVWEIDPELHPDYNVQWRDIGPITWEIKNLTAIGAPSALVNMVTVDNEQLEQIVPEDSIWSSNVLTSPEGLIAANGNILDRIGSDGAQVLYKYEFNLGETPTVSNDPLWPWGAEQGRMSMDDRIYNAMINDYDMAHRVRVTDAIIKLGRKPGDTDGNWVVDVNDINNVYNTLGTGGEQPYQYVAGDCNLDGIVDVTDLNDTYNGLGTVYTWPGTQGSQQQEQMDYVGPMISLSMVPTGMWNGSQWVTADLGYQTGPTKYRFDVMMSVGDLPEGYGIGNMTFSIDLGGGLSRVTSPSGQANWVGSSAGFWYNGGEEEMSYAPYFQTSQDEGPSMYDLNAILVTVDSSSGMLGEEGEDVRPLLGVNEAVKVGTVYVIWDGTTDTDINLLAGVGTNWSLLDLSTHQYVAQDSQGMTAGSVHFGS